MRLSRRSFLAASSFAVVSLTGSRAFAAGTAAVLIHGKQDSSWGSLSSVGSALSSVGVQTVAPDFPWSSSRYLSGNWAGAMAQIREAVAGLRAGGASKIVLVGHSMGCPAAMAYAGSAGGIAGLVLAAPGHNPGFFYQSGVTKESVDRAAAMVKAGRGGETATFDDNNQGRPLSVTLTAEGYLSFLGPKGPANMFNTAGRARVPTMWVVGTGDQVIRWGESIGRRITGGRGKYLVVQGDHRSTPGIAAGEIAQWVAAL